MLDVNSTSPYGHRHYWRHSSARVEGRGHVVKQRPLPLHFDQDRKVFLGDQGDFSEQWMHPSAGRSNPRSSTTAAPGSERLGDLPLDKRLLRERVAASTRPGLPAPCARSLRQLQQLLRPLIPVWTQSLLSETPGSRSALTGIFLCAIQPGYRKLPMLVCDRSRHQRCLLHRIDDRGDCHNAPSPAS